MGVQKFNDKARDLFLEVLAETASPKRAAEAVGVSRTLAYEYRKQDDEFRARWDAAVEVAMERLLEESFRRAVEGVEEPVVHGGRLATRTADDGDEVPLTVRRYSDRLLEVLLKFRYPDAMADRLRADVSVGGSLGIDAPALLRMSPEERASLKSILTKYAGGSDGKEG